MGNSQVPAVHQIAALWFPKLWLANPVFAPIGPSGLLFTPRFKEVDPNLVAVNPSELAAPVRISHRR
jgi:hypothetical protein